MRVCAELSPRGLSHTMARCQALRPSLHDLRDQLSEMTIPVLLAVGDEDTACLETNLMLKSVLPNAGLWICPNTGHGINLEEPTAFNAQLEKFLAAVERGSWRRGYARIEPHAVLQLQRRAHQPPTRSARQSGASRAELLQPGRRSDRD